MADQTGVRAAEQVQKLTWGEVCRCIFTAGEVQIKPPCPPVGQVSSFVQARRRLYLTATLADDSVLVTHFGAAPPA